MLLHNVEKKNFMRLQRVVCVTVRLFSKKILQTINKKKKLYK